METLSKELCCVVIGLGAQC